MQKHSLFFFSSVGHWTSGGEEDEDEDEDGEDDKLKDVRKGAEDEDEEASDGIEVERRVVVRVVFMSVLCCLGGWLQNGEGTDEVFAPVTPLVPGGQTEERRTKRTEEGERLRGGF